MEHPKENLAQVIAVLNDVLFNKLESDTAFLGMEYPLSEAEELEVVAEISRLFTVVRQTEAIADQALRVIDELSNCLPAPGAA